MTPVVDAVYQELLARARQGPRAARFDAWTERFAGMIGRLPTDHPDASPRLEAGWEDALCRGGLATEEGAFLEDEAERHVVVGIARAQRGVFGIRHIGHELVIEDLLSGAEFLMNRADSILRDVKGDNLGGLCQARVLGTEDGCVLLPGAVFHEATTTEHITNLIGLARRDHLDRDLVCDALLHMDFRYKTMSRAKASYAYRFEYLTNWNVRKARV